MMETHFGKGLFLLLVLFFISSCCGGKGGGGGGGRSGGGSRVGSYSGSRYSGYRSSGYYGSRTSGTTYFSSYSPGYYSAGYYSAGYNSAGYYSAGYYSAGVYSGGYYSVGSSRMTWANTGRGAAAYLILSRLAYRGTSFRTTYVSQTNGDICANFEDFNGTMIGEFQCPIDEFAATDTACCGPTDYQYCCSADQSASETAVPVGLIIGLVGVGIIVLVLIAVIICKKKNHPNIGIVVGTPTVAVTQSSKFQPRAVIHPPPLGSNHFSPQPHLSMSPPPVYPDPAPPYPGWTMGSHSSYPPGPNQPPPYPPADMPPLPRYSTGHR